MSDLQPQQAVPPTNLQPPPVQPILIPDPPPIHPENVCKSCGKTSLGELRVYGGTTPAMRGAIVQTCLDTNCNHTIYRTPPYAFNDAKNFLGRNAARLINPTAYPSQRTPEGAVLHLAPPVSATPDAPPGTVFCSCFQKNGQQSKANKSCVGLMCAACCSAAAKKARESKTLRSFCRAHKMQGYEGEPLVFASHPQPLPTTQPRLPYENDVVIQPLASEADPHALAASTAENIPSSISVACPTVSESLRAPTTEANLPAPSQSSVPIQYTPSIRGRHAHSLARPVSALWQASRVGALAAYDKAKTVKTKAQELAHARRITVSLVVWYKRGVKPLIMEVEVSTYPNVQLESASAFVSSFKLTADSIVERWASTEADWVCGTIRTVVPIDPSNRLPLRLRGDIFEEWFNDDCPGLHEELQLQSRRPKRRGDNLVSPVKKIQGAPLTSLLGAGRVRIEAAARLPPIPAPVFTASHAEDIRYTLDSDITALASDVAARSLQTTQFPDASPSESVVTETCVDATDARGSDDPQAATLSDNEDVVIPCEGRNFPDGFTALEIDAGIAEMARLKKLRNISQPVAFPQVFKTPWKKTTFNKYRNVWNNTPIEVRQHFVAYGMHKEGLFTAFLAHIGGSSCSSNADIVNNVNTIPMPQVVHKSLALFKTDYPASEPSESTASKSSKSTVSESAVSESAVSESTASKSSESTVSESAISESAVSESAETTISESATLSESDSTLSVVPSVQCSAEPLFPSLGYSPATESDPDPIPLQPELMQHSIDNRLDQSTNRASSWPMEGMPLPTSRRAPSPTYLRAVAAEFDMKVAGDMAHNKETINFNIDELPPLCPFCDEEYPLLPSRDLSEWRVSLDARSWPAPTLENEFARDYDMKDLEFSAFCDLHMFEQNILPEAHTQGHPWPSQINFRSLGHRLCKMSFTELLLSIRHASRGKVRGNAAQERVRLLVTSQSAGYYGPKGYHLLFAYLLQMFGGHIETDACRPLDQDDMLAYVLVPEAATLLIQDDLQISYEDALTTFHRSHEYGKHLFPVRDDDNDLEELASLAFRVQNGGGGGEEETAVHPTGPQTTLEYPAAEFSETLSSPEILEEHTQSVRVKHEEMDTQLAAPAAGSDESNLTRYFRQSSAVVEGIQRNVIEILDSDVD